MAKHLKRFQNHLIYETYINGENVILPNVSYCIDNEDVHYNPIDSKLIATFYVTDDSNETLIRGTDINAVEVFKEIEIDDVKVSPTIIEDNDGHFQLSNGTHTIKYTLYDINNIAVYCFNDCTKLTNIIIPNNIISIGDTAFQECHLTEVDLSDTLIKIGFESFISCPNITEVSIGSGVITIGNAAFYHCTNLTKVIVKASIPPLLGTQAFDVNASGRKIYVPDNSVNAYKSAIGWSAYAADIMPMSSLE